MFLLYIVVAVCLVFVVFIRVIVALGVGCRILLSYFYSLSFDVKFFFHSFIELFSVFHSSLFELRFSNLYRCFFAGG